MFEKIYAHISSMWKRKSTPDIYDIHKMPAEPSYNDLLASLTYLKGRGKELDTKQRVWANIATCCPSAGALIDEWNRICSAVVYRSTIVGDQEYKYYAVYASWIYSADTEMSIDDFLVTEANLNMDFLVFIDLLMGHVEKICSNLELEHNASWKRYYIDKTKVMRIITADIIRLIGEL